MQINSITDDAQVRIELSKVPTNQIGTNGALDPFFECGIYSNFVTSGLFQNALVNFYPLDTEARQGEIVYLHATIAGTAVYFFNGILWY